MFFLEHLICNIKQGTDILSWCMVLRGHAPDVCLRKILNFGYCLWKKVNENEACETITPLSKTIYLCQKHLSEFTMDDYLHFCKTDLLTYLLREQAAESTETVTDELLALFGMSRGKQDDFTNLSDNEEELPNVSVSQYLYEDE